MLRKKVNLKAIQYVYQMSDEELALEPVLVNGEIVYVNRFGNLWRWARTCKWSSPKFRKIVTKLDSNGYIRPMIGKKHVLLHRIVASAFLGLDMSNTKIQVDHITGVRHENRLDNLRLVTNQQNQHNRTKALGYYWNKRHNKWHAHIQLDNRKIYLGYFVNPEDARQVYLDAKSKYHTF
jgi:hypothetical protein